MSTKPAASATTTTRPRPSQTGKPAGNAARINEFLARNAELIDDAGNPVATPKEGAAYTIRMRPGRRFYGDRKAVAARISTHLKATVTFQD